MANINVTVSAYNANAPYSAADTVTLADTGAAIAALSASAFGNLAANGIDKINATDNVLSLTVDQYQALRVVTLAAGDVITLADSGANIAALSASDIAALADAGIDRIDATDNVLNLSVAQYQALGTVALTSSDTVTLTGTGTALSALAPSDIAALADAGVDQLDATNNVLSLTLAQYQALGSVTVAANDVLTLSGTGASIGALSVAQIAGLTASGFDKINATDNVLTLSVAQYQALGTVELVAGDVITLADSGSNLAALSAGAFAALADAGIDKIDATDNALTLSVAQVQGLGTVELARGDVITLADSGAALAALSAADIANLGAIGIDRIDATDNALSLTVQQALALGSVALTGSDSITLADTGSNLAALTPAELAQLATAGFDAIDASDGALTLSLAQIGALGTMALTPGNTVIAQATAAEIEALSPVAIAALAQAGVDLLGPSDGEPMLSVAQAQAVVAGNLWFTGHSAVLADSGAAIAALTGTSLEDLYLHGVTRIDAIDDVLTLHVDQALAVDQAGTALTGADVITLADTGATLAALAAGTIGDLAQLGIDRIDATDNALALTVAQLDALDTIALTQADSVTLADTGANLAALSAATIAGLAALGIDTIHPTDGTLALSVAQAQALGAVALQGGDTIVLADSGAHIAALSAADIAALATAGIDRIATTGGSLTLSVAQAQALGTIALTPSDSVTLADTGASIAALSATALAALVTTGIDTIDASDDALALTVAQAQALAGATLSGSDTLTLADTGAHIAALSLADLADLSARGFTAIDARDDLLTLSLAQVQGLGNLALTGADMVTVLATGAEFAALTTQDFTALAAAGVDALATTDHALALSVAQVQALGSLALAADDAITLADTAAHIAALTPADLAGLAALGIDTVHATDGALTLSADQALALGVVTLAAADTITLADSAANLAALTASEIAALAATGIDVLDATDDALALTVAQAQALGSIALTGSDSITLADGGAAIAALSATALAGLAAAGIDAIDATDNALHLNVAQLGALASVAISASDTLTLADSGTHVAALSAAALAALVAQGIDTVDTTDNALTLSLAQAQVLHGVTLAAADLVTVVATGSELAALTAQDFADLAAAGVDALATTDHELTLSVAQAQALGGLALGAADTVTLRDSSATLGGLSPTALADLVALGVDRIAVSDSIVQLDATQALALAGALVAPDSTLIVHDAQSTLEALSPTQWATLAALGATTVSSVEGHFTLDAASAVAMAGIGLAANEVLTIEDNGAALSALTTAQLATLSAKGGVIVMVSDDALVLDVARLDAAAGLAFATQHGFTLADDASVLNALSPTQIAQAAGHGVSVVSATQSALEWTWAQFNALDGGHIASATSATLVTTQAELDDAGLPMLAGLAGQGIDTLASAAGTLTVTTDQLAALGQVVLAVGDSVTLADSGAALAALDATALAALAGHGIDTIAVTDHVLAFSPAQLAALGQVTVGPAATLVLVDSGVHLAALDAAGVAALVAQGVDAIDSSDDQIVLGLGTFRALAPLAFTSGDQIVLEDSATALSSLSLTDIARLQDLGVAYIAATDPGAVTFSLAQFDALHGVDLDVASVVLADSGAALAALDPAYLVQAGIAGLRQIDATDDALTLSYDQFLALDDTVALTASDSVTLTLSPAVLASLDDAAIAHLAGMHVDILASTGGALTLTQAQFDALGSMVMAPAATVTLALAGSALETLSPAQIAALADHGIDAIDLGMAMPTLSMAQALALSAYPTSSGGIIIEDSADHLATLSPTAIALLAATGAVALSASSGALVLDLAQTQALHLAEIAVGGTQPVTLADSATALAALSPETLSWLAAIGVDQVHASDGPLTVSVAQALALGSVTFADGDMVILADTGDALANLSATALAGLAAAGVDRIDATNDALVLSKAQFDALGTATLTQGDSVTLAIAAGQLSTLTPTQLHDLASQGIDILRTPDASAALTVAQALALGSMVFAADLPATLVDSGAHLATLSVGDIAALRAAGVTAIAATGHGFAVTISQAQAIAGMTIDPASTATITDSGSALAALSPQALAALADAGFDRIDATDNVLALSLAQFHAIAPLGIAPDDVLTLADSAETLAALSRSQIDDLAARGVTTIHATDGAIIVDVDGWSRLVQDGIGFAHGDAVVVRDSSTAIANLGEETLATFADSGVTRIDASDDQITLSYGQFLALGTVALTGADTVRLWFNGDSLATLDDADVAALVAAGVDMVGTLGEPLYVDLATLHHLAQGGLAIDPDVTVRLTVSGNALAAHDAQELIALGTQGVDVIQVNGPLALSVAQYDALGSMVLAGYDVRSLVDSGAHIAALSPEGLAALAARGVGVIDATDGSVHLSLAQVSAMGGMYVAGEDLAVVDLTAQQAFALDTETRAILGQHGIDAIAVTQGTLTLGLADLYRYADYTFAGGDVVLAESGATLANLSPYDLAWLAGRGITAIDASDDALVLSLAQFTALGTMHLAAADDVTITASAADLAMLSPAVFAAVDANGVDSVEVSGGGFSLTAAQAGQLGNIQLIGSGPITLVDTGAAIAALSADTLAGLAGSGITAIDATTGITINASKYEALGGIGFALADVVTVASNHSFTMGADVDNVTLTGTKNLVVTGNSGANVITGNAGRNTLDGGAGNDRLIGGAGRDVLTGGAGADKFIFRDGDFGGNTASTADRITDFSRGSKDLISLIGVDANTHTVGDDAFAWIGNSAFHHVAGELRYIQTAGNTYVQGDTNGDGLSDFWIRLDGVVNLQATDFQL
ncbi:hypothetical protein [Novosphingobium sp. B-7]|uniref:hypothetical protein n=1 Tax=Novosphingobium sp. B-7 TaxID=1298855 RepID=UPI0003B63A2A|nr:hypothetical protein [Novosphingobium sp. B-7]